MSDLLTKWLAHYDPVHRGWTPRGIATGVCATGGFFFPRVRGGYHLRRAPGGVPTMSAPIVGAGAAGQTTIREFPWVVHESNAAYVYRLNAVGGGGVEEDGARNITSVAFGPDGSWLGLRPNSPSDVRIACLSGGRFALRWSYNEAGQQAAPSEFRVFTDGGTGSVDYDEPAAVVPGRGRRMHYEYVTGGWPHGTRVKWSIRAYAASGAHDGNMLIVSAFADAEGPTTAATLGLLQ